MSSNLIATILQSFMSGKVDQLLFNQSLRLQSFMSGKVDQLLFNQSLRLNPLCQFLQLWAAPLRAPPHRLACRLQGLVTLRCCVVGRDPDGKMSGKVA